MRMRMMKQTRSSTTTTLPREELVEGDNDSENETEIMKRAELSTTTSPPRKEGVERGVGDDDDDDDKKGEEKKSISESWKRFKDCKLKKEVMIKMMMKKKKKSKLESWKRFEDCKLKKMMKFLWREKKCIEREQASDSNMQKGCGR